MSKVTKYQVDLGNLPPLTQEQKRELAMHPKLPDSGIDVSDLPPLTDDFWKKAVKNPFYKSVKQAKTVCVEADDLYRAMAADNQREAEAQEWCSGLTSQLGNLSKADVLAVEEAIRVQLGMPK